MSMYHLWVEEQVRREYGQNEEPLRRIAVRFFTHGKHSEASVLNGNEVEVAGRRIFNPRFVGVLLDIDAGRFALAAARLNDAGCTLDQFCQLATPPSPAAAHRRPGTRKGLANMTERDLSTMTNEELYIFKDRLQARRDEVKGRRGPGPSHTRHYCRVMRDKINAILKSRDAPLRPLDSEPQVYGPGNAHWQKEA